MYQEKIKDQVLQLSSEGKSAPEISRILSSDKPDKLSIESYRRTISNIIKRNIGKGIFDECESVGIPLDKVKHYWYKGKNYSINVKGEDNEMDWEDFKSRLVSEIREVAPINPRGIRERSIKGEAHCLVFDPADIHIGKLCSSFETGEEYNSQIAVKRVKEGLYGILDKASGWNIDKVIFIVGNDILHIDTPKRTTTSGTPQDTDGMWYENFVMAKKLLIDIIYELKNVADVEVVYNPSNHDYMSGFMLIQCVEAYFSKTVGVTFNVDMSHRKYTSYGTNLIGTTHMDGAKASDLPLLMAHESGAWWHECRHRYIYGHHVHHKTSKDFMSVCVETLRSPSGTDSWHHRNGYQHSPKAVEAFIHHPEHGQVARLTHLF